MGWLQTSQSSTYVWAWTLGSSSMLIGAKQYGQEKSTSTSVTAG